MAIDSVYSRNKKNAKKLVSRLYNAKTTTDLDFSNSSSNWFFLTVPDHAIEDICKEIILPEESALIHTSGSTPMDALLYAAAGEYGVFYPFQTFTKGKKLDLHDTPLLLEASSKELLNALKRLARKVSNNVIQCTTNQRQHLHLAGVFTSNFTNYMLTIAREIAATQKFSKDIVYPLLVETINKALEIGPEAAQTGPAKRGDLNTLDNHHNLLDNDANTSEIYKIVSRSILDKYQN